MSDQRKRGLVCMFCGEGFGYEGERPDEATLKAACDHEAVCPRNPYKQEADKLRSELAAARAELEREKVRFARMQESFQRENDAKTDAQALLTKSTEERRVLRAELAEARSELVKALDRVGPMWRTHSDPYWQAKRKAAGVEG